MPIPDTAAALVADSGRAATGRRTAHRPSCSSARCRPARRRHPAGRLAVSDRLPDHLRPTYQVLDADGSVLGQGKDLAELQSRFAPEVARRLQSATADLARDRLTDWDFEELPRTVRRERGRQHPDRLSRLWPTRRARSRSGCSTAKRPSSARTGPAPAGCCSTPLPSPVKTLIRGLDQRSRLTLSRAPHGSPGALLADCVAAAVDAALRGPAARPGRRDEFARCGRGWPTELRAPTRPMLPAWSNSWYARPSRSRWPVAELTAAPLQPVAAEVARPAGRAARTPASCWHRRRQLPQLRRYLRAMLQRLPTTPAEPGPGPGPAGPGRGLLTDLAELAQAGSATGPIRTGRARAG